LKARGGGPCREGGGGWRNFLFSKGRRRLTSRRGLGGPGKGVFLYFSRGKEKCEGINPADSGSGERLRGKGGISLTRGGKEVFLIFYVPEEGSRRLGGLGLFSWRKADYRKRAGAYAGGRGRKKGGDAVTFLFFT